MADWSPLERTKKVGRVLMWRMMIQPRPETVAYAYAFEIVEGSGLLDQSSLIEQIVWSTEYRGIIVSGLQPSIRDYAALEREIENMP